MTRKMSVRNVMFLAVILTVICSCSSSRKSPATVSGREGQSAPVTPDFRAGPPATVYKTRNDYRTNVPVILSDDQSRIVSYPHPKDLYYKGELAYPTELAGGYLLDNRGINAHVAFLKMTYEEYSKLDTAPPLDSLYSMILDKDPLLELYNCGNRYAFKDEVSDLNQLIRNNELDKCKCLVKK
jgi:hypothetical protein